VTVKTLPENRRRIEAAFNAFHAEHPEVYAELVRVARRLRQQGWERFGIATVFEVVRYRSMIGNLAGGAKPKLNNNHRAYYSRLIMEREPDLAGVFKTRQLGVPSHIAP
jgi:hypothetical protein